ncbi:MAG: helix-turn-helix domain-containing protein [Chloroflexi bacterium]|nr:helix-turn-helix domain-containing protein [Chloroflexota bacterium]
MSRPQKEPLRSLTNQERSFVQQISRTRSEPASHVARTKAILAVAEGHTFTAAARRAGRRSGDAVAKLVVRFNREGLAAIEPRHGGGPEVTYGEAEKERILAEFRRTPDREQDGTATWSVKTLQRALRAAPDGLPRVSAETIWRGLRDNGITWQRGRSWCETGKVVRKRKSGPVAVIDPDAAPKKS